jgi:hypothetical protein
MTLRRGRATRPLVAAVAAILVIAVGVGLWRASSGWRAERDERVRAGADTMTAGPATDAELERLRTEIEAERAAERGAAGRGALARVRLDGPFSHARHRNVRCLDCHSMDEAHGTVTVASTEQCRSCHHTAPLTADCTRCHQEADFRGERRRVAQTFTLTVGDAVTRDLVFAHIQHRGTQCTACHGAPLTMAVTAECTDCHQEHHRPEAQCMGCHTAPPRAAHTVAAHLGCTAAGCHDPSPVAGVPRTRPFCLSCHQELVDHERGLNCADCHTLPPPRGAEP